jgi:hypothetical protein
MEQDVTADRFCKIIGLKGGGTSSKYVAKGLIVLEETQKIVHGKLAYCVDIDRTIEALMNGRENHQQLAQKAIDFFRGIINENNAHSIIHALEHAPVIDHIPQKNQDIISENNNNFSSEYKPSLMEAMRDKNLVEIKLKQLQINEKVGRLIDKETVLKVFENILIQVKKDLLNLARTKIDAILREKDNPQSAEKILYDGIHEILHRNSGSKL